MAYRNLFVQSAAHIRIRNAQLQICTDETYSVPLEDVSALLLESRQSSITTAALAELAQNGTAVYCCNEKHLPCGILLPYAQHSRFLSVFQAQSALTQPRKKHLWQQIVRAKIHNQAECLKRCGHPYDKLEHMASQVRSGDSSHLEAVAAAQYFIALFDDPTFVRGAENTCNAALNYGYAILRGSVARKLAVYGFTLCLGLQHCSMLNAMNLADDIMEPFRPVVDLFVASQNPPPEELTPELKYGLFNLLNIEVLSGSQKHSVSYAIDRLVQSLIRALENPEEPLLTPCLLSLEQHTYE